MMYLAVVVVSIFGILAGIGSLSVVALLLMTVIMVAGTAITIDYPRVARLFMLFLAIGIVFFIRGQIAKSPPSFRPEVFSKQSYVYTGTIINNPQTQKGALSIIIDHVSSSHNGGDWYGKIQASIPPYTDASYGDRVRLTGKLQPLTQTDSDPYRRYLYYHQTYGTLYQPNLAVVARNKGNPLLATAYQLQQGIESSVIRNLPKDEAGLLLGVTLGLQQPLSKEFSRALNNTSTTHIIVASGYNATIIVSACIGLASQIRRHNAILLAMAVLVGYVALSGFNPSMIRAALMAGIALSARVYGRQRDALHLLALTALLMLVLNPWWIFDISFQLSFAATLGIILLEKPISSKIVRLPMMIREIVSTTSAAQICSLPIISLNFGSVAVLGMIANVLVLWLVPWMMAIGAITVLLVWISPWLAPLCLLFAEPLLWYVKQAIILSANLPLASLQIQMAGPVVACYYLVLIIIVWRSRYALAN